VRSLGRLGVVVAGVGVVALAAGPAYAKGDISVSAPRTAVVGKAFKVSARGDDDAARYLRICVEVKNGTKVWRQVGCGAVVRRGGPEGRAAVSVKAVRRGGVQVRGVMWGLKSVHDRHPVRWRTSGVVSVRVR